MNPAANPDNKPAMTPTQQAKLTAANYRQVAFTTGIPFRPNGLFPIDDYLLTGRCLPFRGYPTPPPLIV
jgi:hypothetical protein